MGKIRGALPLHEGQLAALDHSHHCSWSVLVQLCSGLVHLAFRCRGYRLGARERHTEAAAFACHRRRDFDHVPARRVRRERKGFRSASPDARYPQHRFQSDPEQLAVWNAARSVVGHTPRARTPAPPPTPGPTDGSTRAA